MLVYFKRLSDKTNRLCFENVKGTFKETFRMAFKLVISFHVKTHQYILKFTDVNTQSNIYELNVKYAITSHTARSLLISTCSFTFSIINI